MSKEDSKPWYRYFWSLYTLYLASTTSEPVLPEYQQKQ